MDSSPYKTSSSYFLHAEDKSPKLSNRSKGDPTNFSDLLKCYICFEKVHNAVMCPQCSKLCCEQCIKVCFGERKTDNYRNG